LVAEELRDGEPADRFAKRVGARSHHAREGGSHLGTQRDVPVSLVAKGVKLPDDLGAALARVQVERLERRPVILDEAEAPGNLSPGFENVRPCGELLRVEVPEAGKATSARAACASPPSPFRH